MRLLDYDKVLQDFQYKPNWAYKAYEYEDVWYLRVMMMVEDSRRPWERWEIKQAPPEEVWFGQWNEFRPADFAGYSPSREVVEVTGTYEIPPFTDEMQFIKWMVFSIEMLEKHETDEWARYKGVLLNDPHKENS